MGLHGAGVVRAGDGEGGLPFAEGVLAGCGLMVVPCPCSAPGSPDSPASDWPLGHFLEHCESHIYHGA